MEFLTTTVPRILTKSSGLWRDIDKIATTTPTAVLTEYIVTRAIDKLNETVSDNIGILYDIDDNNHDFDPTPLVIEESMRDDMMVFVVNTATVTYPAATFTEARLDEIRNLFSSTPTYNITLRNGRQHDFLEMSGNQLSPYRLKQFLSFVAGFSVVIVCKVTRIEEANFFLRPFLPASNFDVLPEGWQFIKMISLTKSFYYTGDVDSAAVAVSHHCNLFNVHQLLARVEPLRRQGRPTNTANYMSRQNDAPRNPAGYKALMRNMILDSNSWSAFMYEKCLVDIDGALQIGVVVRGRLATGTQVRTNGVQRTPYIFTVRVLNGIRDVDLGDEPFRDIELNENAFVNQWAETAARHESGKIPGIQHGLYTGATGENNDEDDA